MVFSHDGLRDSLTYLAAPPLFYEFLRRELASSSRNRSPLALAQFHLIPQITEVDSLYEAAIVNFSQVLKNELRSEDLCARLGRFEFTLIIKSQAEIARRIAARVQSAWEDKNFLCSACVVSAKTDETALEILNRLDNQEKK